MINRTIGDTVFRAANGTLLTLFSLLCLFPMVHILMVSFSSGLAATAGEVSLLPVGFTTKSYQYMLERTEYWRAMGVSAIRIVFGVGLGMLMNILAAYPLSRSRRAFRSQPAFAWYFLLTMLFNGGLMPTWMLVRMTGLIDSMAALVIPASVSVFNVLILTSFFRNVPQELEEAAFMDGAGHWRILLQIFVPVSLPALATLTLFTAVWHWNAWFDGIIYMNSQQKYPLQSYLQTVLARTNVFVMTRAYAELLNKLSDRTLRAAQVIIAVIPVLLVYPFLQRYFITGIMLGSVKE